MDNFKSEPVTSMSRTLGKEAQKNNILAAKIVADIVKTTLGPKGMDKMLVDSSGNVTITNDGVTILEEMELDHPAAKIIVDIAKSQEQEVGDGTTTVAILAGSLLENAEKLIDRKIHPTLIIRGYKKAAEKSREILESLSLDVESRETLKKIAMTSMTGKGSEGNKEYFAELIVSAIDKVSEGKTINLENIKITKIQGSRIEKSELVPGIVLDKERAHVDMPSSVKDARILLLDVPLEIHSPETESRLSISTPEQLQSFLNAEEETLKFLVRSIVSSQAQVVFCQKGIDDVAQYYLAQNKIMAFRRIPRSDMERISKATNAKIISNINEIRPTSLGQADVDEVKHSNESFTYITSNNTKVATILLHGTTQHLIDEIERSLKDGLGVVASAVREGKIVVGGGSIEIALSLKLREYARTLQGKEQLAVEEFANTLEKIPETLAENAGLDSIEVISELKRRHSSGNKFDGLNLLTDRIENCLDAGIVEPLKVKTQAIDAATEVATLLLRVDDVLIAKTHNPVNEDPLSGMD